MVLHAFKCGSVIDSFQEAASRSAAAAAAAADDDKAEVINGREAAAAARDAADGDNDGGTAAALPPPPLVLVLGGTDVNVDAGKGSGAADALARRSRAAARVVAFSDSMVSAAPAGTLPAPPKTVVIPQGIDLPTPLEQEPSSAAPGSCCQSEDPLRVSLHEALGVEHRTPVLLLPAGLRPVKDVLWAAEALVHIAAELKKQQPGARCSSCGPPFVFAVCGPELDPGYAADVRNALIGPGGNEAAAAAAAVRNGASALLPAVPRATMVRWMAQAAAVLNTSVSEGQSGAILEAAALGTPVLARDNPGNRALLDLLASAASSASTWRASGDASSSSASPCCGGYGDYGPSDGDCGYEVGSCGILASSPEGLASAVVREILPSAVSGAAGARHLCPGRAHRAAAAARIGASAMAAREAADWGAVLSALC